MTVEFVDPARHSIVYRAPYRVNSQRPVTEDRAMKIRTWFFVRIFWIFTGLSALSATSMGDARNSFGAEKNRRITGSQLEAASQARVIEAYAKRRLYFERNQGQADWRVKFLSRGPGHTLFVTPTETVFVLAKSEQQGTIQAVESRKSKVPSRRLEDHKTTMRSVLRVMFSGASAQTPIIGQEELAAKSNYFVGGDSGKWTTGVRTYGRINLRNLYPGIDLTYYGSQSQLEYDLLVRPGADPKKIKFAVRGANKLEIDSNGDLLLHTPIGAVRQRKPIIYQEVEGQRREISGGYVVKDKCQIGFELGAYDRTRPLVIDPVIVYSTYLGGSGEETAFGIAVDSAGNAYVTGRTASVNYPTTAGALQPSFGGSSYDSFVSKVNASGTALVYSTYLGGSGSDEGFGIAVDSLGNAYVTGRTDSSNFPTTPAAFKTSYGGSTDAFVSKLNSTGTLLLYSTYLGGSGLDEALGIALDGAGNAYMTGDTTSTNFPKTSGAFQATLGGNADAFVTKLNASGSALVYSTYLGGSDFDEGIGIAVDSAGSAYVSGETNSLSFPKTLGAFQTTYNGGSLDGFVTKLNSLGTALNFSTYLGGSGFDEALAITVDSSGNVYVAGDTDSINFPTTPGAFQPANGGDTDGFVTKLNSSGTAPVYSTYLGGAGLDIASAIALDALGNAYVTGETTSADFPTTPNAFQKFNGGPAGTLDAFVTKLNSTGTAPVYSTYLGGSGADEGMGIALDSAAKAYVVGDTSSTDFPTTSGAFQTAYNGGKFDAFVTKIMETGPPATLTLTPATATNTVGQQHCVTATVKDSFGNPTPNITVIFSVTGANSANGSKTTDSNGQATFCYTGTKAGTDTINAFADTNNNGIQDSGEPSATASKTYVAAAPATLTLTPATATNTVGQQHCVTATVKDAFGNATSNVAVIFSVTGANSASGSKTTDSNGQATFCYTGTKAGTDTIKAFADTNKNGTQDGGEPSGTATKTYVAGAPATLVLTPATATNIVGQQHCVTATVKDSFGNATPNITVVFSVTGANSANGSKKTDANGQATFCYTGTKAGADTIKAFADTNNNGVQDSGEPSATASKTYVAGAPATLTLTPATATNTVGQQHCVTATVKDAFGNATSNVAVIFSVTGANSASDSKTTDANGQAVFCYTGTKAGIDTIKAFADINGNGIQDSGEPSGTASKTYVAAAPATLTLTPATATNTVGQQHCVTATVKDSFGNATPNITVVFSVTGANSANGSKTTDSNGQATFCYTGTKAGADTIKAFADTNKNGTQDSGEPSATASKTYVAAAPATLTLTPATATNTVGQQHCVTATVKDTFGNATPNVTVIFSVTGANSASGSSTTDSNGQAIFCYTGTKAGIDTINAFADTNGNGKQNGNEPSGTASKTYVAAAPASLTLAPATATNITGQQHCVTATVKDAFGNPTPLITVVFSINGANSAGGSRITDANGQATFCYTGTKAGVDTIKAFADTNKNGIQDSGEPSSTASKTYVAGAPPPTLKLTPKTATDPVGQQHCVTATLKDALGNPMPNVSVVFSVTGSVNTGGTVTTNASGQAQFCYMGPELPGQDNIKAFADLNKNGMQDAGEPFDTATKTWVLPVSTGGNVEMGVVMVAQNGDSANAAGNAITSADRFLHGNLHYTDNGPAQFMRVRSLDLLVVVISADQTKADIYGHASINDDGSFLFKIHVEDNGEPGIGTDKYRILLGNGYDSGLQTLQGGNIQIRGLVPVRQSVRVPSMQGIAAAGFPVGN